jgi:hypothetical protein
LADNVDKRARLEDIDDRGGRLVFAVKDDAVIFGSMLSTPEAAAGDEKSETLCIVVGFVGVTINPIVLEA